MNQNNIYYQTVKNFLQIELSKEKPGLTAHKKMAPLIGEKEFRTFQPSQKAKASAVLILVKLSSGSPELLFTLRSENLKSHKGQISFPGGRNEKNESLEETSKRETLEEIGIDDNNYEILGQLTPLYVPPSESIIHPFVALLKETDLTFIPSPEEVEEIFYLPFDFLANSSNIRKEEWDINGFVVDVPFWNVGKPTPLWGATAMILSEFIEIFRKFEF